MRPNHARRLKELEDRARRLPARSSGEARRRLKEILDKMAAARLGLLGEEEAAEARETFEEVGEAVRRRLAAIRGEGASVGRQV